MDFLSRRSDAAIRKEICGIRDSYHHYWDLLAELLQNSRDAITRKKRLGDQGPFFISVEIDPASNSIRVIDNGTGISSDVMSEILAPGGGDKGTIGAASEVGEKGVGLTYAVFSCNKFEISSRVVGGSQVSGSVINAQRWLNNEGVERPVFELQESVPEQPSIVTIEGRQYPYDSFTEIAAGAVMPPDSDVNIFQVSPAYLRLLLRTRTAIGVTTKLFEDDVENEFDVYLSLHGPQGTVTEKIEAIHVIPHALVPPSAAVTLLSARDAFVSRADPVSRRRFLQGKTVWSRSIEQVGGWTIKVYGAMFPDNDALDLLSETVMGVPVTPEERVDGSALLQPGIFVGTKGMPTGLKIPPKQGSGRYPAYYKRCFFLVESEDLKFDLGRKSLHYRHVGRLQTAVAQMFSRFEEIAQYQGDARVEAGQPQLSPAERRAAAQEQWAEARALPDLNEPSIRYEKHPNAQEAAVAAIFHELIGAGQLSSYRTLRTGYGERYDAHIRYVTGNRALEIVVEFKFTLDSLIRDLVEKRKHFADIDLLVAWDADVAKLASAGFQLDADPAPPYQGVTHRLSVPLPGIDPIPVILLRTLLDSRRAGNR